MLGLLGLELQLFDFYLALLDTIDELLLTHPLSLVSCFLFLEGSDLTVKFLEFGFVVLPTYSFTFDLELSDPSSYFI